MTWGTWAAGALLAVGLAGLVVAALVAAGDRSQHVSNVD